MIIDYNFFGFEHGGCVWDTPICTDLLDELQVNQGVYDEIYIDLDTDITSGIEKPTDWLMTTIMDAKFQGNLDAGSVGAEGFKVTNLILYRSIVGTNEWSAIAHFGYDEDYNVYTFTDRFTQNGATYQYAVVPVANEVIGDKLLSSEITSVYEGIFLTDKSHNKRLEYDINLGEVVTNTASAVNQPINGQFPVVTFGNSNYRSGNLTVLPLSRETVALAGMGIDKLAEQVNRQSWLDFLNNRKAKVLRMDNGVLMLVVTTNVKATHREGDALRDLADVTFDYVEIGNLTFENMVKSDLIAQAYLSNITYDENGGIIGG